MCRYETHRFDLMQDLTYLDAWGGHVQLPYASDGFMKIVKAF